MFGLGIWIVSPYFIGDSEPWDAPSAYYWVSLLLAGVITGLLSPQRFWLWPIGIWVGQCIYGFYSYFKDIFFPSGRGVNFFIPLGMFFMAVYSVVSLCGTSIGMGIRRLINMKINKFYKGGLHGL